MKADTDRITPDEWLLRIVHHQRIVAAEVPPIRPSAFEPRAPGPKVKHPDLSGISLYRLACLARPADVLAHMADDRKRLNGVVGFRLAELAQVQVHLLDATVLTLSARSEAGAAGPDGEAPIPGHVVVPELRSELFAANRSAYVPVLLALATLASRPEAIFLRPAG